MNTKSKNKGKSKKTASDTTLIRLAKNTVVSLQTIKTKLFNETGWSYTYDEVINLLIENKI